MASTSFTVTASPSPTQGWTYDVFLSFRGPDTRKTFIDFLYESLERKGIRTFKDDDRLEKGDCISPSLLKAIEESQFLIAVFSKGYASSKWCLEELATMMECHEKFKKQIVVPIFYHVEPSDVRKQEGSFGDSFKELLKRFVKDEEKVRRWKETLKKAGYLKGHHLQNDYNGYEATCAEKVAADIHARLNQASLAFEKNLVGLESRVNSIINWLRLASDDDDDARFIGICGMGGIGKTTTAMFVFNRFSHQFDGACFLADVRQHNIIELQKTLLTEVLKEKSGVKISNVDDGKAKIMTRLKGKKVLIVLDDVDDQLKQLDKLAGGQDWFGRGSRVIITTRNEGALRSHGVDEKYIYHVNTLEEQEAIQLFSLHAFKNEPKTGMEELCESVVHYCEGLPLALTVLGSHLCGKNVVNRKTILKKLEDANSLHTPKDKILNVLRISFDGLDPENKNVFLDITCFFRKWREEYVKGVLDSDLCELIEKSLISVQNGRIEMHDRIQEMGRYIASQEKPWRLWQLKDAVNVLSGKMDHKDIEGISWSRWFSDVSGLGHRPVKISFREMINLKMFKVDGRGDDFHFTDNDLPNSLRWLQIQNYRFASLPESFASSELVGLSLQFSSLQNWRTAQKLDKLTLLDLSCSYSLLETPDFDWMPNLRRLNLLYCYKLKVVHPSIGNLSKLVLLNLRECRTLKSLPSFNQVSSLNSLNLCGCIELKNFPEIKERMPHLVELELIQVGIIELHSSIQQLQGLTKLYLDDCEHLVCLPNGFFELKNLVELKLRKVGIIELPSPIQQLQGLTKLYLDDCEHLVCLSNGFCELKNLKVLVINCCTNLKSLPENLQSLNSLEYLNLNKSYFDSYPESFNQLTRLQHLDIRNCENFRKLPKLPETICQLYADSCFSYRRDIDELVDFPELQSVAFSSYWKRSWYDFAEMCIHFPSRRKTHFSVTYPIYFSYSKNIDILRIFQYRCYYSNGIAIDLNPGWNCQSFVGFAICFLEEGYGYGGKLGLDSYRDIADVDHCTIIVKLSCKDNKNEVLQRKCDIVKPGYNKSRDHYEDSVRFAYIPFSGLWPAKSNSVTPNDLSRFEVNFMDLEATAHWGCSLLYERSERPTSWDDSCEGSTTDIGPLGMLEYLNLSGKKFEHLPEDISLLCRLQYLDISGCTRLRRELPKLPPNIKELYATSYLASKSNIVELATKYSKLYSVSFSRPIDDPNFHSDFLVPWEFGEKFIAITQPFLNRNTPFAVHYPIKSDPKIRCFKYTHSDPHKIFISLDPSWYSHNFVGFVVCFVVPRYMELESRLDNRHFSYCQLITKLTHKDNGSELSLQTECVIGRLYDKWFGNEIECFVYIPFSTLWPKSKAITNNTSPNHYLAFEATIQVESKNSSDRSWYKKDKDWSCDLLYTDDKSLTEAIRQKRESGSSEGDSVNEKEKEREDEQRKKDLLNNDKTLSSSKQNKKIRDQSNELSVTDIQPPIVGNNASKHLWDNFINSLAAFLPDKDYIELEIDQALFHHTNTRSIVVMIEDLKDLMRMECLDVSIIQVFILFLNKLCNQLQVTSIGFVNPAQISMDMVKQNAPDVTSYFINVMDHDKNKQFILAPYNQKFHWLLLVICIRSRSLYVLDPLPCDRIIEIKEILNTAFDSVSTNGPVNWKQCKCPIQPGGVECGYYVMRYMFDIVTKYSSVDCLDEAFESNIPYSINEINEIRDLWAKSFLEECRQTEEGSVFTQLDLVTGEAEHSEQTPVDEDCEAEVEANQGTGEAEQSEPNPANEDCDEAAQKSVLTQLEHDIGEAEHSEQTPVDEDCEAEVEANQCAIICRFWQFGLTDGSVKVIEPLESIGNWEVSPPINNDEILNGQPLAQPPATMCRQQTKLGDETECILILMVFLCCFFAYKHLRINLDASYQGDEMHCTFMLAVFFCIFIGICFRFLLVFSGGIT